MPYMLCIYPMAQQNIVKNVQMNCEKCKTKAMRITYKKKKKKKINEDVEFDMFWVFCFSFFCIKL